LFGAGSGVAAAMQRAAGQLGERQPPDAWPAGPYQPLGSGGPIRYGQVLNSPVPDAEGRLQYILHRVTPVSGPHIAAPPATDARPDAPDSQRKAEQILNSFSAALVELDGEYRYRYLNHRAEEMLGMQREALLGRVIWEVFPHTVGTPGSQAIVKAAQGREKAEAEYLSTVYGRWMFMSAVPNGEGGVLLLMYDRHDVHQAQQQLAQEHRRLKQAQAIGHIGSFEWTPADDVTHWSDEMYRIYGLEPQSERMNLQRVLSFIHPEDKSWVIDKIRQAQGKAGRTGFTHRLVRPDGEVRYIRRYIESFADETGKVTHLSGVVQDITEQKRAEQEGKLFQLQLQQSAADLQHARAEAVLERQRLHNIFMQAPALICIFEGPRHVFRFVNPPYQQLVGARPLLGLPIAEAMPELAGQPIFDLLDGVYRTGETFYAHEMQVQLDHHNQGELGRNYYNFIYQAIRNPAGEIDGIFVFAYEVTVLVAARQQVEASESALQHLNEQLAAANQELRGTNAELVRTQRTLQRLNADLEARVGRRTAQLEAARTEAEAGRRQLHALFMEAPAPIVILDGPELVLELVNPAYQRIFPGRDLRGKPLLAALPEVEGTAIHDIIRRVYATGETFVAQEMPLRLARQEGQPLEDIYFTFMYQARRNGQGAVDGILVFGYEVTDQVNARRAVEAHARQLRLITDALPVLIGYVDQEEKYRFANRAYQPWFGRQPEELLGLTLREVLGEPAYAGVKGYVERALAGEHVDFEARMPYRENFTRYIRTSYVPDVQAGRTVGFYTLVSDVTDQVEARRQVEQREQEAQALAGKLAAANAELVLANEQLKRTNTDLDNFVYTASHDLKAPILNVEGLLKALERQLAADLREKETVRELYRMLYSSVNRFKVTIADLTEVARIGKESSEDVASLTIGSVLDEVRQDLAPQIAEAAATLDVSLEGPPLQFSRKNLKSILYNLLGNAVKYHSPDRPLHVRITCRVEDGYQVLTVADNGL
ncbi:MAG TPA: PAS domain-containing protein, partial [Cytophagales bacterium]